MEKLFVYGTLRRDHNPTGIDGNFIDYATVAGTLYDLMAFPGIKLNTDNIVYGEVWEVSERMLKAYDQYEGCPYLFSRKSVKAHYQNLDKEEYVFIYEYNMNLLREDKVIESGDWIKFLESTNLY